MKGGRGDGPLCGKREKEGDPWGGINKCLKKGKCGIGTGGLTKGWRLNVTKKTKK